MTADSADVHTLNDGYDRSRSTVLVRRIDHPTRAALDYAAYHANFMIADLPPEGAATASGSPDTSNPFRGMVEKDSFTGDVTRTLLTAAERAHPLAFAPALQFLQSRHAGGADALDDAGAAVRSELWGLGKRPESPTQTITEMFLHTAQANSVEIWVKIEFVPWFKAIPNLPDQDGDGFPEIYGRLRRDVSSSAVAAVDVLRKEYASRTLEPSEIKGWANQLSSYWYPSFNTDLVEPGPTWPDDRTEPDIRGALAGRSFANPTVVLRGKPQGRATYQVFLVQNAGPCAGVGCKAVQGQVDGKAAAPSSAALRLAPTKPAAHPQAAIDALNRELAERGGGSWTKWAERVQPLDQRVRERLRTVPKNVKAFAGAGGYLFYRNGLEYLVGGDIEKQRPRKNPLPIILEFQRELASHGVDFLFVAVPTKEEIFADKLDAGSKPSPSGPDVSAKGAAPDVSAKGAAPDVSAKGAAPDVSAKRAAPGLAPGDVANPYSRKFLLSLSQAGVEVVDLWPAFLSTRSAPNGVEGEPIFQLQDTHWTDRGLRLAAGIIAGRVQQYPWYKELVAHARKYSSRETTFSRLGDLVSRLPEDQKSHYQPESLVAHQVLGPDGAPYEDDPDSPIVVLGDSFTSVYELTDAEHAGVTAHLAMGISYPVDLVMSYGGGPNVRQKLMRRGADALGTKKLVVWVMTARDLYNYSEDWEPLKKG